MRPASTHLVLTLVVCALSGDVRAELPRMLDEPVLLKPARVAERDENSRTTVRPSEPREPELPRSQPVRLGRAAEARTLSDDESIRLDKRVPVVEERSERSRRYDDRDPDVDDFLERRSRLRREQEQDQDRTDDRYDDRDREPGRYRYRDRYDDREYRYDRRRYPERSSEKFGDRIKDLLAPSGDHWWFSDHAFDQFASPISNPFLAEDPRALTEVRPLFIYQNVPKPQPNFRGGNIYFFGTRASLALTEKFSITLNKLGGLSLNPSNKPLLDSEFGFAELWLGPKFTFYRDPQFGTILAAGAIFQIPTGPPKVYQDTGSLSIVPYLSVGKTLTEFRELGTFNGILNTGYAFSANNKRSEYFYMSAHLDLDFRNNHRFSPIAELNYFQYTRDGRERAFSGEGHDLFNFGSTSKGASLVTGALGGRFKITEAAQIGGAFELPLFGNKDVFKYRFTMDLIFRY